MHHTLSRLSRLRCKRAFTSGSQHVVSKPLQGLLVVALEQAVAAPLCTCRLADAGARVIKVERDSGDFARSYDNMVDGQSTYFTWLNRGKESVVLDFKQDEDAALLQHIISKADVFVQNLAPGAASRAGFGSEELRALHPRLITLDISGYGDSGPMSTYKAYDLLVQAESGMCSVTGSPESAGRVGISICDISAGQNGYSSILEALLHRMQTGVGKSLKVSLFSAASDLMAVPFLQTAYTGKAPKRIGLNHPALAPYGVYKAAGDSGAVLISIQNEREWKQLCHEVLGNASIATDPRFTSPVLRVQHRAELDSIINAAFGQVDRISLAKRLFDARIAFASLNSVADLLSHPQLSTVTYAVPGGTQATVVAPPVSSSGEPFECGAVPALGEHSDSIRLEFRVQ